MNATSIAVMLCFISTIKISKIIQPTSVINSSLQIKLFSKSNNKWNTSEFHATGTIIGANATELTVSCYESNECNNLIVDCPLNLNLAYNDTTNPQCALRCYGENSCNDFVINTHSSFSSHYFMRRFSRK